MAGPTYKVVHLMGVGQQSYQEQPTEKGSEMTRRFTVTLFMLGIAGIAIAQVKPYPTAKVSFDDFKNLVAAVEEHRSSRLIDVNTFVKMSKEPGVVVLDTRSDFRFERIHLRGARHLSFSDFTQSNLAEVIPSFNTKILIYCNNNFEGNEIDFASKIAMPPVRSTSDDLGDQFAEQEKPIMMALNIPTYINLYGYGYQNIYELHELVNVNDPRIEFEGSIVKE